MAALTGLELNRATLARQGLLEPISARSPAKAVERLGSLQAQHPEWPPIALAASVPPVAPHTSSLPPLSRAIPQPRLGQAGLRPGAPRSALSLAAPPNASLVERLLPGGVLLGSAILVTILDQVYSSISGEVFTIGPLRTSVLAGLVMAVGVGLCLYRLKRD